MATRQQLTLYTGETFVHTFIYRDAAGQVPNLAGATAKCELRSVTDPTKIYVILTTANGRVILDAVNGYVTLKIPDEDTTDDKIKWAEALYDVRVTFSSNEVDTPAYGKITVKKGVTVL